MSERLVCAMAIGGLDPGGGAGILADLRAFHAAGVFGTAVTTLTTVQSTNGLRSVQPIAAKLVLEMAREVLKNQTVKAIKTGAIGPQANVKAVASLLRTYRNIPVVIDPVMIASRGSARLLETSAVQLFRRELLPMATLVTPNVPEAEIITKRRIAGKEDARDAALRLCEMGAAAAIVKGGHLAGSRAVDVLALADGTVEEFSAPRLPVRMRIHGGGCMLASLIAGRLAAGDSLIPAIRWSKQTLHRAISDMRNVGGPLRVILP